MKQNHQQKHLFRSSYCLDCKQRKSCGKVSLEYCCSFYYQSEQEKAKEYSNYEKVSESKKREQKASFQQLQLLKSYQGCPKCGSKEIDSYELYENNRLVCQPCLMKKRDSSTNPISFSEQSKWYKRWWKINLTEWLKNLSQLPVNKKCAGKWKENKEHLNNCNCLA